MFNFVPFGTSISDAGIGTDLVIVIGARGGGRVAGVDRRIQIFIFIARIILFLYTMNDNV